MTNLDSIKRAVIEVNGRCNYTCTMCPQSDPGRDKRFLGKMSLEFFQEVLNKLGYVDLITSASRLTVVVASKLL